MSSFAESQTFQMDAVGTKSFKALSLKVVFEKLNEFFLTLKKLEMLPFLICQTFCYISNGLKIAQNWVL